MGKVVLKLNDNISTDTIYPGRFMATVLPSETPQYAFADHKEFNARLVNKQISPGSIIVAGNNFGCGSSREQAASCLKGHHLVVIAKSFSRIFLQNAINLGLKVMACPSIDAAEDDELELVGNEIRNTAKMKVYPVAAMPKARQSIIDAGGLIAYARKKLLDKHLNIKAKPFLM